MNWKISYFNNSVYKNIMEWPSKILGHYLRIIDTMEKFGPNLGMSFTEAIGAGLFEIRAKGQEGIGRALFCYRKGGNIIILNGFIKKTNKIPSKELDLAMLRMKEVQRNEK